MSTLLETQKPLDDIMPMDVATHRDLQLDMPAPKTANGRSNEDIYASLDHPDDRIYHPCPEAYPAEGAAVGAFHKFKSWRAPTVYQNTLRDIAVYLPSGGEREALDLIVFNDGAGYATPRGAVRATHVLDSLYASGQIKPTAAVFINPGIPDEDVEPTATLAYTPAMSQRSLEYDALTPRYGNFLVHDVLPFVAQELGITFSEDPTRRTICGISSGGICAFSVAWFHPDHFRRVISHCGSFTNILGGHNYPYLVRSTTRKPIRVFLQSGAQDAFTLFGDWPTANMAMAKALTYAGYDVRFEFGQGGHTLRHGGALFADSLRWLWRD